MWTLHVTGGLGPDPLIALLADKDEYIRAWAIQLLNEDRNAPAQATAIFTKMAREDKSPVVRLYLASAMQRVNRSSQWSIAAELIRHAGDSADHNLPKLIWFGMEPLVKENPDRALALAANSFIPMLAQFIARRTVDADATDVLISWLAKMPATEASLLEGMRDALEGRYDMAAPASWKTVYTKLSQSQNVKIKQLALAISQQFGDTEAAAKFLATLKNRKAPVAERRQALQAIANRQRKEAIIELPALMNEPEMRIDAIRAIAAYDEESLGQMLLDKYHTFNATDKLEVIQTMSSRSQYGWMLSRALSKKTIPKSDVPTYAARQLLRVVGSGFIEVWGPIEQTSVDQKEYARYRKLLTDKSVSEADPLKGREIFLRTCGPCHKMYGEGGIIGPDLTGSNRSNVEYLLSNVMDPSGEIQDDYKMVVVTTRDGRNYAGNVAAENDRRLTMRVVGKDALVINKSDIQSREETKVSMMPAGLFKSLKDSEILSLVAFLRTSQPVRQPK